MDRYLEMAGTNLLAQGKLATNLLRQANRKSCHLKLAPPVARTLTSTQLAEEMERAVVVVGRFYKCKRCAQIHHDTATGFFLTESGALATCLHMLGEENGMGLAVMTRDGRICPVCAVLAADPANDVAILQVEGSGFSVLPVAGEAPLGSAVSVLSHPAFHFYTLSSGQVSGHFILPRKNTPVPLLTITADFATGSSGAPVCNAAGAVVGIAKETKTINQQMVLHYCAPSSALLDLIKPSAEPAPSPAADTTKPTR